MPNAKKIEVGGTEYSVKDQGARDSIGSMQTDISGIQKNNTFTKQAMDDQIDDMPTRIVDTSVTMQSGEQFVYATGFDAGDIAKVHVSVDAVDGYAWGIQLFQYQGGPVLRNVSNTGEDTVLVKIANQEHVVGVRLLVTDYNEKTFDVTVDKSPENGMQIRKIVDQTLDITTPDEVLFDQLVTMERGEKYKYCDGLAEGDSIHVHIDWNRGSTGAWSIQTFADMQSQSYMRNIANGGKSDIYVKMQEGETVLAIRMLNTSTQGVVVDFDIKIVKLGASRFRQSWLCGKKINWLGDSIVAEADFDEMVCNYLMMVEQDYGINGSTIAVDPSETDSRSAMVLRYSNMDDDADVIAVSGGTNDFQYSWCPIGTIESTTNTTFYGALKNLCEGLINKYPDKVIFFTTPIKRAQPFEGDTPTDPFSTNEYGKTLKDYRDIIIEVCGYYSIPVLDLWAESMLNPHITSQQVLFTDLTHPNERGKAIMARRVTGWLLQLGQNI
jgi:lysophospholipase L1-like esterase